MFTREPAAGLTPPASAKPAARANGGSQPQVRTGSTEAGKSVISNDLKIIGQGLKIISRGILQVDGEVEGDVAGAEVIIGEQGKVTGTVRRRTGDRAREDFWRHPRNDRGAASLRPRGRRHPPHVAEHRTGGRVRRKVSATCRSLRTPG